MITAKQIAKYIVKPPDYTKFGDNLLPKMNLIFQDNGADVLAVAHTDTVRWLKPNITHNHITNCPQLDDHLGIAILLEWLKTIGKFDILLTDDEEVGQSTASYFDPPRQYKYMVEFDRAGSDCVFYQYDNMLRYTFDEAGWDTGHGTFSDIAFLGHIGCEGVNIGVGYHHEHSERCYCALSEVNTQLAKFATWYKYFGQDSYPYEEKEDEGWLGYYTLKGLV